MSDRRPEARLTESADIVFAATVRAERMRLTVVPETSVTFHGEPAEESACGSRRIGFPDRVAQGVVYHAVQVDYVIAARLLAPHSP
jgi:hypothetical protein